MHQFIGDAGGGVNIRHTLGAILLAIPFVGVTVLSIKAIGWLGTACVYGAVAVVTGLIIVGCYLIDS